MAIVLDGTAGITTPDLTDTSLTSGRVVYAGTSGDLTGSSAFQFDGANVIVNATTPAYFTGTSNLAQISINRSPSTGTIFNASQSAAFLNIDGDSAGSSFQFATAATANTQPSEKMRLTNAGRLGIGTSAPTSVLDVRGTIPIVRIQSNVSTEAASLQIQNDSKLSYFGRENSTGDYFFSAAVTPYSTVLNAYNSTAPIIFGHNTAEVYLQNGGLFAIGTTTAVSGNTNARLVVKSTGVADACEVQVVTNGVLAFDFRNSSGTQAGSIVVNASTTAFNTSSDYRLKNTIAPMTGALAKVALLKPVTYKWNADGSDGEGFIAHELAEVVPDCVHGIKDALDANGNIKPQGIDVSFLVATLTAAIQEQQALITTLTERITALEGA